MGEIKYCKIHHDPQLSDTALFSEAEARKAKAFHSTFAEYCETPLAKLDNLAKSLGVKGFYVKDESYRFGLNAFKALGGTYCVGKCIEEHKAHHLEVLSSFRSVVSFPGRPMHEPVDDRPKLSP
ncbi:MAG: hypothetical protein IIZ86_02705, partial [Firmicutes bacterium]|nr:hypothetical protein [Bacillota bacterium]